LKKPFYSKLSSFILLLIVALACNKVVEDKKLESTKKDSVETWIQQSKSRKLTVEERRKALKKAYEAAESEKSDSIKNNYYSKIALEAEYLNNDPLFKKVNFENLKLATKLKDTLKIGDAHWNYGSYYQEKEVIDSAYFHFHKAYESFKSIRHELHTANMLYNLGYIQGRIKDYTGSEISLIEAITIYKKLNRNLKLYRCYNHLGLIYYNLGEFDRAIFSHNKALDYLKEVENKGNYKVWSLNNLGLVYQKLKDYEKANDFFKKALDNRTLKEIDINFYARLKDNIAYTKFLSGDTLNIINNLNYALKIRDSLRVFSGTVISKRHLSEFYAYKLDTLTAVKYANEAYGLAKEVENNRDKLETLLLLSKVDKQKANIYLAEYVHLNDSLHIEERKIRNKFTRIRFETDEYIEETEKLSEQKILISLGAFVTILILSLAYYIRVQNAKNKELLFEKEQQKSNEEIFSLMLKQQAKLEEGRMTERHRIAQDLHDGVLGKIFGTRLGLGFLNLSGDDETIEKHQAYVDELQNIEKEIRTISHELKFEILSSKENFSKIIEDLIIQKCTLGAFGYEFNCDAEIDWNEINDEIKINFYRIIQEALQNIIKYANAKNIIINIELEDNNTLKLNIKDNGIGFDPKSKRKGIGLKNMQSRANNLKGNFSIHSEINSGTHILVSCTIQNIGNE